MMPLRNYIFLIILASISHFALANDRHVDIFTTEKGAKGYSLNRFKQLVGVPVYIHHVDAIKNFEQQSSKGIKITSQSSDIEKKRAIRKISDAMASPKFLKQREAIKDGVRAFEKAMRLGITKVPAIVFDDEYIVYGERPLKALRIYNSAMSKKEN